MAGVISPPAYLNGVIEEQARGSVERSIMIRKEVSKVIGPDLSRLSPGSAEAMALKEKLISPDVWGSDRCRDLHQVPTAVGYSADVGLHPISNWNNPEPEIVVIAARSGRIVGGSLGNDVNLRDVEGRSALLVGGARTTMAPLRSARSFQGGSHGLVAVCGLELNLRLIIAKPLPEDSKHARTDGYLVRSAICWQATSARSCRTSLSRLCGSVLCKTT